MKNMQKRYEKGSEEFMFFMDYWKFIQDYAIPEDSDEFWEKAVNASTELGNKYNNTVFVRKLITAFMESLEEVFKNAE